MSLPEGYNSKANLKDIFHGLLPSQGSVYTACQINGGEIEGRYDRVLLSSIHKDFRVYSSLNPPEIDIREKMYSYLPQGCEIVSVDVFRAFETPFELITGFVYDSAYVLSQFQFLIRLGITWMASQEDEEHQPTYYFNIYESGLHYDVINLVDSIELNFVPFQLTHAVFGNNNDNTCFVISGSDHKCHVFFYSKEDHTYSTDEDYLAQTFPELVEGSPNQEVALWIAFDYTDDCMKRFTAIAHECGTVSLYIVDIASIKVLEKHTSSFEGPVTRVLFFNRKSTESFGVRLLALSSLALSKVFYNIETDGLSKCAKLPMSDEFDVATCGLLADLDFDKK